jgi:hypothetical protein
MIEIPFNLSIKLKWTTEKVHNRNGEQSTSTNARNGKTGTFQDIPLTPSAGAQELWRWLYTELRAAASSTAG